jgi:hypothetical protein
MTVIPFASRKGAALTPTARRRGQTGLNAPLARASGAPAGTAGPTALVALWELGPTGRRLRWRLGGAPIADDAADGDTAA